MDDFSDDGLDDLNDNALQELENNAIQQTQAQPPAAFALAQAPSSNYFDDDDDDLDDTVVIDESAQPPARHYVEQPLPPQQPRVVPRVAPQPSWAQPPQPDAAAFAPHARYPTPSQAVAPQRPLPSQPFLGRSLPPTRPQSTQAPFARPPPPPPIPGNSRYSAQGSQAPQTNQHVAIADALRARVHALEMDLLSAKGEASLMRSKFDEARKAHDLDVVRLKKQNAEQLAKQEHIAEAAVAAEKTAATELEFTRHDLREEIDRGKKGRKESGVTTPRKGGGGRSNWDLADGFDDVEILPSPSKGQGRRVKDLGPVAVPVFERTPTKGKRKRPVVDSPVMALETHSGDAAIANDAPPVGYERGWQPNALPFDFLQLALDHGGVNDRPLTFDLFARYAFPSEPLQSFASTIFQKLPQLGNMHEPSQLLVDFCLLVLDLWSQCLREKYHAPIFDLVSLLSYFLQLDTISVAPRIVSSLVPIAQTTIYLLAIPALNSPDGNLATNPDSTIQRLLLDIDTTGALSAMYLTALGCLSSFPNRLEDDIIWSQESPQTLFWQLMQFEFVLMMLSPKQPPDDFLGMLSLLRTSVLPDSVGPITGDPNKDTNLVALVLVDRLSSHLIDPPKWAPAGSYRQYELRLALLNTLASFTRSLFGYTKLAESEVAIPRMVTMLCGALDSLYDMGVPQTIVDSGPDPMESKTEIGDDGDGDRDPDQTQDQESASTEKEPGPSSIPIAVDQDPDITPLLLKLISSTTLLLHTLITDPVTSDLANVPAKLTKFQGGYQRYLITLARLSFAEEDLVFEAGLDAETVELAHELLELAVTPDEGEGVGEAFGL